MPKVSVIVPVHNAGKYLVPMINSIIFQTFKDIEIFLIDDGSTDGSREVLKYFESLDDRITVIFRDKSPDESFGQKYSADLGRSLAKGEYIMMLDHDDELIPNAIEILYSYTNEGKMDVVQGRNRAIDDDGNIVYRTPDFWPQPTIVTDVNLLSEDLLMLHLVYAPIALWACLIRNDFQKDLPLSDRIFNDTDFIWELKIKAKNFCYIPEEVYINKMHSDSSSGSKNIEKIAYEMFYIIEYLKEFLEKEQVSDKIWQLYYAYKFYSLQKMHVGSPLMIQYKYNKRISEAIRNDPDVTHLLMIYPEHNILMKYLLLKNAKDTALI